MNSYEITISGNLHPVRVRATSAAVALRRALNGFTDSQFLNSAIVIRFTGRVPRTYKIRGSVKADGYTRIKTIVTNLDSRKEAERQLRQLRHKADPQVTMLHITSEEQRYRP